MWLSTCSISKCEKVRFTLFPIGALIFQVQFLEYPIFTSSKQKVRIFYSMLPAPVVRIEPGEVGAFDHSGKSGDLCVAKSAISEMEASSCHAVVCSEPYEILAQMKVIVNLAWNLTLTIFPSDSTTVPVSASWQNLPRSFLFGKKVIS